MTLLLTQEPFNSNMVLKLIEESTFPSYPSELSLMPASFWLASDVVDKTAQDIAGRGLHILKEATLNLWEWPNPVVPILFYVSSKYIQDPTTSYHPRGYHRWPRVVTLLSY